MRIAKKNVPHEGAVHSLLPELPQKVPVKSGSLDSALG